MRTLSFRLIVASAALSAMLSSAAAVGQVMSIQTSKHNLSAAGPGAVRASSEQEICVFCHTPHTSSPIQPVWNRNVPVNAYTVYSSNSLSATPGQPTGSSKLCLSCHDGSIAVGSVLSRDMPISMAGGITTLPPGGSNLGTDLSDDHPISFRYDQSLAGRNVKLKSPELLPRNVRLDPRGEMQCTSCHNAHDDSKGKFLVMDNSQSQLCNTCHQMGQVTTIAEHQNCASCHQQHSAPSGAHLLRGITPTGTCGACHAGQLGPSQGDNVLADLNKISRHGNVNEQPTPGIRLRVAEPDSSVVSCSDCHEPHTMQSGTASAPRISPTLGDVSGINASGAQVPKANYNYEVCFKCHADQGVTTVRQRVNRQIEQTNTRLEFAPSAVSFHPIEVQGKNSDVPSLRPGLTNASMIYCVDCHASDTGTASGSGAGANGPHGSNIPPLLSANYDMIDGTGESATAYALCYKCHERSSILGDQSFVGHQRHIVNDRTPCSVCHDAHGVSSAQGNATNNSRLMNFDVSVVQPDPTTGRLEYRTLGPRRGECYLSCHGVAHSPKTYPAGVNNPNPLPGPGPSPAPATQPQLQIRRAPQPGGKPVPRGLK